MEAATSINAFFIGLTTVYYALMSYQLFVGEKRGCTRLHKTQGLIFVVWTVNNAKDTVLTLPSMCTKTWTGRIIIADGWGALTYMAFLYELTRPGWITTRHMAKAALPFTFYTLLYIISLPQHGVDCSGVAGKYKKKSGFKSIATSRRAFRKITGTTPGAYKEQQNEL